MLSLMTFLPFFIQSIWQCQPLEDAQLLERLERLCQKGHFKHGGIKSWIVMGDSLTAAIIGIVSRFRYIMFTKRLLNEMSPEMLEAILAHEMGHSKRKHLLIYPFILMGMMICTSLFSYHFENEVPLPVIFIGYLCIIGLYFRFFFGFFSRLFERQADLHVFEVGVDPQHMIEALDRIGIISNYSHKVPSWHHFSIQERIDFLQSAIHDPKIIAKHHQKVKSFVIFYFILLLLILIFLSKKVFYE
jgi:STE24 endopeptidase